MTFQYLLLHNIYEAVPVHRENIFWMRFDDITSSWIPELKTFSENFELPETESVVSAVEKLLPEVDYNMKDVYGYVLGVVYSVGATGIPYLTGVTERRRSF